MKINKKNSISNLKFLNNFQLFPLCQKSSSRSLISSSSLSLHYSQLHKQQNFNFLFQIFNPQHITQTNITESLYKTNNHNNKSKKLNTTTTITTQTINRCHKPNKKKQNITNK
jgi:hypothetical protein